MLQVQNLTAGYGPLTVLNGVSLSLEDGARLGVFGHNGAGKTTLLRCIVGAVRPVAASRFGRHDTGAATSRRMCAVASHLCRKATTYSRT